MRSARTRSGSRVLALLAGGVLLAPVAAILTMRFRETWMASFNQAVTNRITGRFAARLPGFGIVTHVGRSSGRVRRTPVNVFPTPDGFLVALTYGRGAQWVRNVMAAGGCELETRGIVYRLSAPEIVHDPSRRSFPLVVRSVLGLIGASDYLRLSTVAAAASQRTGSRRLA